MRNLGWSRFLLLNAVINMNYLEKLKKYSNCQKGDGTFTYCEKKCSDLEECMDILETDLLFREATRRLILEDVSAFRNN